MKAQRSLNAIISEGHQKRQIEQEKIQDVRDLYETHEKEKKELEEEKKNPKKAALISAILINLVFLSFHLCEPEIDWVMVATVAAGNAAMDLLFLRPPVSWIDLALLGTINLLVALRTQDMYAVVHFLYDHPVVLAAAAAANAVVAALVYVAYYRRPLDALPASLDKKEAHLIPFYRDYQWSHRKEMFAVIMLIANVLAIGVYCFNAEAFRRVVRMML